MDSVRAAPAWLTAIALVVVTGGCAREPTGEPSGSGPAAAAPAATTFVNRVWQVRESSAVAPGTLYVFLSEGTLVITSPHSRPTLGTWKQQSDGLTMIEDGIPYRIDVLALNDKEFRIRSHNPGEPIEIALIPAP